MKTAKQEKEGSTGSRGEVGVPWAGKQNLPKASTRLGTPCHRQHLLISSAQSLPPPSPAGAAQPAQGMMPRAHWHICCLVLPLPDAHISRNLLHRQLSPLCSSPSSQWAQAGSFFPLSSSDISVSLKYSDDLVLFSSPPHQILPLLVEAVDFTQAQEANLHPSGFKIAVA